MSEEKQTPVFSGLTEKNKQDILDYFKSHDDADLTNLTCLIFNDERLRGQTKQARAVKDFCKENNLPIRVRTVVLKGALPLTESQIQFIENNFRVKTAVEIARELYDNPKITNFNQEYITVNNKIEEIKAKLVQTAESSKTSDGISFKTLSIGYDPEQVVTEEYKSPRTLKQTIDRVNHYLNYGLVEESLKKQQRFELEQLKKYLNVFRFIYQINTYKIQGDRDLFEDAFIRYTHDKPDLTQEDLDQFITLCNQIVRAAEIQRRIEALRVTMASGDVSMKINEAINVLQSELNACETLKNRLYNDLTTKRNQRLEEKNDGVEKLTNLVQAWKDEEFRNRTIHLAELEKMRVKQEVENINSMSELKALLRGATLEELSN